MSQKTTKTFSSQALTDAGYVKHSGTSLVDGKTVVSSLWSRIDRTNGKLDIANTDGFEISLDIHEASVMVGQLAQTGFAAA